MQAIQINLHRLTHRQKEVSRKVKLWKISLKCQGNVHVDCLGIHDGWGWSLGVSAQTLSAFGDGLFSTIKQSLWDSEKSPTKMEALVHPSVFQGNSEGLTWDCLQNHRMFYFSHLQNFPSSDWLLEFPKHMHQPMLLWEDTRFLIFWI